MTTLSLLNHPPPSLTSLSLLLDLEHGGLHGLQGAIVRVDLLARPRQQDEPRHRAEIHRQRDGLARLCVLWRIAEERRQRSQLFLVAQCAQRALYVRHQLHQPAGRSEPRRRRRRQRLPRGAIAKGVDGRAIKRAPEAPAGERQKVDAVEAAGVGLDQNRAARAVPHLQVRRAPPPPERVKGRRNVRADGSLTRTGHRHELVAKVHKGRAIGRPLVVSPERDHLVPAVARHDVHRPLVPVE
eukprot:scaffold14853_cov137-Isochrysis_galbana.AAC.2